MGLKQIGIQRRIRFFGRAMKRSPIVAQNINELVVNINALMNMQVRRGGSDALIISDSNVILQLARSASGTAEGGSALGIYKLTSIANLASDYVTGKLAIYDNSNTESLASTEVNIALPWELRAAQPGILTPAYAVHDYIVAAGTASGVGLVVSGAQLNLVDLGIGRTKTSTASMWCQIQAIKQDYYEVKAWAWGTSSTGAVSGGTFYVAKVFELRGFRSGMTFGGVSHAFSAYSALSYIERTDTAGSDSEKQDITPPYEELYSAGSIILAMNVIKTGVQVSGLEVPWIDMNQAGRAWSRKHIQS